MNAYTLVGPTKRYPCDFSCFANASACGVEAGPLHWYIETSAERVFSTLVVASAALLPLLLSEALAPQPVPLEVRERRPRTLGSVARAR